VPALDLLDDDPPCTQNSVLYLLSCMQYLTCCLALSISKPFRKPITTNYYFFISVLMMLSYQSWQVMFYNSVNSDIFDLLDLPRWYRFELAGLIVLNSICSYGFEKAVNSIGSRLR